jgi:hypothetical protein
MKRKRVVVLGATGSIGESALKVARDIPERMEIIGLAANSNAEKLAAAANATRAQAVCLVDESKIDILRKALEYQPRIFSGEAGLREIASLTNADMVLIAIVGTGGLRPALAAIEAGKDLAVASKEILVMAGEIVMREAREKGVQVLPVDSEHNAIFQCLQSGRGLSAPNSRGAEAAPTFLQTLLTAATNIGSLLCDGIGDAILIRGEEAPGQALRLSYNILQAAGSRIFKTDYVACPSCGRTLFNLQTTTARIKAATLHLKGVKIAIMGCIVNGPGEMADADFGYVGGAPGKVNLYVGKTAVKFNIPEADAVERLQDLIREHGKWVEPASATPAMV